MTAVHQFVPALLPRDATGDHTMALREAFRAAGWQSEIYVEAAHDELLDQATYFEKYPANAQPGDILLYQASTGSPVAEFLMDRPETLVLDYHNITPASFYEAWEPHTALKVELARQQVAALAPRSVLGIADSAFNAAELKEFGCPATEVVPIMVNLETWADTRDPKAVAGRTQARTNTTKGSVWLFVGRLSPNKNQHELLEALWMYRRWYDPEARLHLVGPAITGDYAQAVMDYAEQLGLKNAIEHGEHLSPAELAAWYDDADVFVCLSDHEGFCIPLLEAMRFDLPIVAFAAGAVPETLGQAGVLLESKRPSVVAAAVNRVLRDQGLATWLTTEGRRRLTDFDAEHTRARFVEVLANVDAEQNVSAA